MKKIFNFILLFILINACSTNRVIVSEKKKPTVKANNNIASLRAGEDYWHKVWTMRPELNPNIWYVKPESNKSIKATLITDIDSISFDVYKGQAYDFDVILNNGEIAPIRIKGVGEQAYFSAEYQEKYRNKTIIEIPEVYELINTVFALTPIAAEREGQIVMKDIDYLEEVFEWFKPYENHKAVQKIDSILYKDFSMYFGLKMDAYIYDFKDDKIVSKGIYNVISNQMGESLISSELLRDLEDFSKVSNFRKFYNNHKNFYQSQISYYEDEINIANMQLWLNKNFPKTSYDCFKVIFSPLVSWNQSARWFDNDGFKEAQAHVNFPYPRESNKKRTRQENILNDGEILFTELNHAFINPEAEPYFSSDVFRDAFPDISFWTEKDGIAAQSYGNPQSLFNEMMNWSLVSLYFIDNLPRESADKLISQNEEWQTAKRGFTHFRAFNQNLIKLYTDKPSDKLVADLYPQILKWAKEFKKINTSEK